MASRIANRTLGPRLRIVLEPEIAIGPGKADLLEAIETTGSIAGGGRSLGMSYRRAWSLVEVMNRDFGTPVVDAKRGGAAYGGAELTRTGKRVLTLYRRIEKRAGEAIKDDVRALRKLIANASDETG